VGAALLVPRPTGTGAVLDFFRWSLASESEARYWASAFQAGG